MAYQDNGSPLNISVSVAAAAQAVATLAPTTPSGMVYIYGFTVTSHAPAANVTGVVTITGVKDGPLQYQYAETTSIGGLLHILFPDAKGIPAANRGGSIVVTLPAITGGAASCVTAYGYQM